MYSWVMFATEGQQFWWSVVVCVLFEWYWIHKNGITHVRRVGGVIGVALSIVLMISLSDRYFFYNYAGPLGAMLAGNLGGFVADILDDMREDEEDD